MKNSLLGTSILFLLLISSCGNSENKAPDSDNHIDVAKAAYYARWTNDLEKFKDVSTNNAYSEFETEINLLSKKEQNNDIDNLDIEVRADSVINDIAWVSLKFSGQDMHTTLKLIKTATGWKNDNINYYKEKSPIKKETVTYPKLR